MRSHGFSVLPDGRPTQGGAYVPLSRSTSGIPGGTSHRFRSGQRLGVYAMLTAPAVRRRPGAAEPKRTAAEDVSEIAARFGLDAAALRRVVEEGTD